MFHTQVHALRRSFDALKVRMPQAPTTLGLVEQFTTMDFDILLSISCVLWASTPAQRQDGYRLLDRALTQVKYPLKGQPTGLATALDHCGWNVWAKGKPSTVFQRLLDRAFPCRFQNPSEGSGGGRCVGSCAFGWHRHPDPHHLKLAIEALLDPDRRESIAKQVLASPKPRGR
jgi:hypothetical protein